MRCQRLANRRNTELWTHVGISSAVAFDSMQLKGAEKNYPVHEKELLAIIRALKKWRSDLLGTEFFVYTDGPTVRWKILTHKKTCHADNCDGRNFCHNMTCQSRISAVKTTPSQMRFLVYPPIASRMKLKTRQYGSTEHR